MIREQSSLGCWNKHRREHIGKGLTQKGHNCACFSRAADPFLSAPSVPYLHMDGQTEAKSTFWLMLKCAKNQVPILCMMSGVLTIFPAQLDCDADLRFLNSLATFSLGKFRALKYSTIQVSTVIRPVELQ